MEYSDVYEYISVLLLGIAEEISEYRSSVYKMQSIEDQVSEYGDLLWNVAELENTLSEIGVKNDVVNNNVYDVSLSCVQTVRKHYFRERDNDKIALHASSILVTCMFFFVNSAISREAMDRNCEKMKARHG